MNQRLIEFKNENNLKSAVLFVNDCFEVEIVFCITNADNAILFKGHCIAFDDYNLANDYVHLVADNTILNFCKSYL